GTNAHLVLQEYPEHEVVSPDTGPVLFVLSAKRAAGLVAYAEKFITYLQANPTVSLRRVTYTLQTGREAMRYRLAIVAEHYDELLRALQQFVAGDAGTWLQGEVKTQHELPSDWLSAQRRQRDWEAVGRQWVSGAIVAWTDLYPTGVQTRLSLPTYPFNRQSFWLNTGSSQHAVEAHSPSAQIQQFVECWEKEDVSQSMPIGFSTVVYVLAQDTEQAWLEADSEDVTHVVFCRVDELESQADYERLFAQLQSEGKSVDAVVYVSTGEDDYGHIHTLLQGLH
ncbi:hypothetical protein, partial [Pseudoalteromonas holothuriae]|uniref:KS-MAT linker domain-containing protein n=2 Tax=Pseudoalteromonas holothuriae TaxID=2963714 RepID=UPI0021C17206